jgi:hypothetical protein
MRSPADETETREPKRAFAPPCASVAIARHEVPSRASTRTLPASETPSAHRRGCRRRASRHPSRSRPTSCGSRPSDRQARRPTSAPRPSGDVRGDALSAASSKSSSLAIRTNVALAVSVGQPVEPARARLDARRVRRKRRPVRFTDAGSTRLKARPSMRPTRLHPLRHPRRAHSRCRPRARPSPHRDADRCRDAGHHTRR